MKRRIGLSPVPALSAAERRRAFEYGAAAYRAGKPRAAALDQAFLKSLKPGPIGSAIPALEAWNSGWDQANLSAGSEAAPSKP